MSTLLKRLPVILLFITLIFQRCYSFNKQSPSPRGYDLNHPTVIDLPSFLDEISGIIYYAKDTSLFAVSDANGVLYKMHLHDMEIKKWKFGKNQDYEDLQLLDSTFYILASDGNIICLQFDQTNEMHSDEYIFPKNDNHEFESLYYDVDLKRLMLLCKDCKEDEKSTSGVWSFDPFEKSYRKEAMVISIEKVSKKIADRKKKFHPSAAAINPVTHQLFIISAFNHILLIADKSGSVEDVYPLDPNIYKQSEGIAFTQAGDMIISNEAAEKGNANLLVMKYKR